MFRPYFESAFRLISRSLPKTQSRNSELFISLIRGIEGVESKYNIVQNKGQRFNPFQKALQVFVQQVHQKSAMELSSEPDQTGDIDNEIEDMLVTGDIEDSNEITELDHSFSHAKISAVEEQLTIPKDTDLISTPKKINEQEILHELLFVFQGIQGTLFKINTNSVDFNLSEELESCVFMYPLVTHLAELGTLHLKVMQFLQSVPLIGAPPCVSALVTSIKCRLRKFYKFVADLDKQLVYNEHKCKPTLLRFKVQIAAVMDEMHWLAIVAETCKGKKGGAILSELDNLMNHGNPRVHDYLKPLFVEVAKVYYTMLGNWLKATEFYDPNSEFFIARAVDISQAKLFWKRNYYCIRDKSGLPPTYISKRQAKDVLDAGWNIALLRKIMGRCDVIRSWNEIDSAINIAIHSEFGHLAWRVNGKMHLCVEKLLCESSAHVVQALLDQGKLHLHLNAIAGHFLFTQEFFAREFIRRLSPVLDMPAPKIKVHSLKFHLNEAIVFCNFPLEKLDISHIIQVELSKINHSDNTGWDIVSLKYEVNPEDPITLVISKSAIKKYQHLFKQILRAKEVERILVQIESITKEQYKGLHFNKDPAANTVRCMSSLISEMRAALRHTHYFQIKYIKQQWENFQVELTSATNITTLVNAHDKFLNNVMLYISLDEDNAGIRVHLLRMHDLASSLQSLCTTLCSIELVNSKCDAETLAENGKTLIKFEKKLFALKIDFDKWMISFLAVLKESSEELQNLAVTINYNAYYEEIL